MARTTEEMQDDLYNLRDALRGLGLTVQQINEITHGLSLADAIAALAPYKQGLTALKSQYAGRDEEYKIQSDLFVSKRQLEAMGLNAEAIKAYTNGMGWPEALRALEKVKSELQAIGISQDNILKMQEAMAKSKQLQELGITAADLNGSPEALEEKFSKVLAGQPMATAKAALELWSARTGIKLNQAQTEAALASADASRQQARQTRLQADALATKLGELGITKEDWDTSTEAGRQALADKMAGVLSGQPTATAKAALDLWSQKTNIHLNEAQTASALQQARLTGAQADAALRKVRPALETLGLVKENEDISQDTFNKLVASGALARLVTDPRVKDLGLTTQDITAFTSAMKGIYDAQDTAARARTSNAQADVDTELVRTALAKNPGDWTVKEWGAINQVRLNEAQIAQAKSQTALNQEQQRNTQLQEISTAQQIEITNMIMPMIRDFTHGGTGSTAASYLGRSGPVFGSLKSEGLPTDTAGTKLDVASLLSKIAPTSSPS
ncbi:MAG TPA: hypothetical protein VNZ53_50075 [Steroidobacteraceae bacterium]|jgi:hypothetical protein|nr:hypothetical protein [Steroidobacteraceae bacterium]